MRHPLSVASAHQFIQSARGPSNVIRKVSPRPHLSSGTPKIRTMTSRIENPNIENTDIRIASGVNLSEQQRTLVGSVLDLFAGRPSLKKLRLWTDDATFEDPITIAQGRKQYEPQWYGLQAVFSEIERLHHEVTSAGNPIRMDLRTKYVVKGLKKEQTVDSKIEITYDEATGKITKVTDKWDGKLPDSSFKDVSFEKFFSPRWWFYYTEGWAWWMWSWTWNMWWWQALRNLNSVTVPLMVSVPKNDEEDAKRGNQ